MLSYQGVSGEHEEDGGYDHGEGDSVAGDGGEECFGEETREDDGGDPFDEWGDDDPGGETKGGCELTLACTTKHHDQTHCNNP